MFGRNIDDLSVTSVRRFGLPTQISVFFKYMTDLIQWLKRNLHGACSALPTDSLNILMVGKVVTFMGVMLQASQIVNWPHRIVCVVNCIA